MSHCSQYHSTISSRLHTRNQADYHTHLLYAWQHALGRKWWYNWSIETIEQSNEMILLQDLGLHQPPMPLTTTWSRNGTESRTKWEWENTSLCVETPHNTHVNTYNHHRIRKRTILPPYAKKDSPWFCQSSTDRENHSCKLVLRNLRGFKFRACLE